MKVQSYNITRPCTLPQPVTHDILDKPGEGQDLEVEIAREAGRLWICRCFRPEQGAAHLHHPVMLSVAILKSVLIFPA